MSLFAAIASICGLVVIRPLLRRASLGRERTQVTLFDVACLTVLIGAMSSFAWLMFPAMDKEESGAYVLAIGLVACIWWFVVASAISRVGGISIVKRGVYQVVVVPFAFLTPLFCLINAFMILQARSTHYEAIVDGEIAKIVVCVAAYLACVPMTTWLLEHQEFNSPLQR